VHRYLHPWTPPAEMVRQPRAKPPAALPPPAREDVTPRVGQSGRTQRGLRQAAQRRPHQPRSMPAHQAASARREMAAGASGGREWQHAQLPSREPPQTAHRPEALRQRVDSDRPPGSSREIPRHLRRVDRRRAPASPSGREQPETPRVARDQLGGCRPPLDPFGPRWQPRHPFGPRLIGQSRHWQDWLERDLSRLERPG